jgi:uncharacterized phage protein (TIGR01671 family)
MVIKIKSLFYWRCKKMKEVKFRAVLDGEVLEVTGIDFTNENVYLWNGKQDLLIPMSETILLQYTGLKDCSGKEIYEGDIIRDNDGFLWIVYFEDGMYCAKEGEYKTIEYLIEFCPKWCEVIGNIYEHSHLLKAEN